MKQQTTYRFSNGFSLVEMMVSIVIVSVLSIVAYPSYKKHILKAKTAEAYQNVDVMRTMQLTYFSENKYFASNTWNPVPDLSQSSQGVISTGPTWDITGYPLPVGSRAWFKYMSAAGQNGSSERVFLGSPLASTIVSAGGNNVLAAAIGGNNGDGRLDPDSTAPVCTNGRSANSYNGPGGRGMTYGRVGVTAPGAGVTTEWVVLAALGNITGDNGCRLVYMLLESSTATNSVPGIKGGPVQFEITF